MKKTAPQAQPEKSLPFESPPPVRRWEHADEEDRDAGRSDAVACTHHMIDLETLGTKPGCVIVSIGCVKFDPFASNTVGELVQNGTFLMYPDRREQQAAGLICDVDTTSWWISQNKNAQKAFGMQQQSCADVIAALDKFLVGCKGLWCNGPSFDTPILREFYDRLGATFPVQYWNDRDCRTMKYLGGSKKLKVFDDFVAHDALQDSIKQALEVQTYMGLAKHFMDNQLEICRGQEA